MSFEGNEIRMENEKEDPQVELALKHFRESVHAWSEREMGREIGVARKAALLRSGIFSTRMPVLNWAAAAVLAVAAVSGPVAYHEHQIKIQQHHEAKVLADKKMAEEIAARQQAYAMDDEELLKHVDSDIAQQAPDAMEPLASLMTDEKTN